MKFSIFFLILILLVGTSLVSADLVNFYCDDNGISLGFKDVESIQVNQDYTFGVHIYNSSYNTGEPLTNTTSFCAFHLYNHKGEHLIANNNISFSSDFDFYELIDAGNFTQAGSYPYNIACFSNDLAQSGFCSSTFHVTSDGNETQTFPYQFLIILLAFLFIVVGVYKERLRMFKYLGSLIFIIMGVLTLYPGYGFINWETLVGKALGFSLIALGFWFFIEDAFSRDEQEETYQWSREYEEDYE